VVVHDHEPAEALRGDRGGHVAHDHAQRRLPDPDRAGERRPVARDAERQWRQHDGRRLGGSASRAAARSHIPMPTLIPGTLYV
jgi:hypothetical protein